MVFPKVKNYESEKGIEKISPLFVGSDLICDKDEYDYKQVTKAFMHILIIPAIIFFIIGPNAVAGYFGSVSFLYATVFRKKSKEYFSILFAIISLYILLILS